MKVSDSEENCKRTVGWTVLPVAVGTCAPVGCSVRELEVGGSLSALAMNAVFSLSMVMRLVSVPGADERSRYGIRILISYPVMLIAIACIAITSILQ